MKFDLFKKMGDVFDPNQILDLPDWSKSDEGMILFCELLDRRIGLNIPIKIIQAWAKHDAKLNDDSGEAIPFEIYYHGLMDFDREAKMELARYTLRYHPECKTGV